MLRHTFLHFISLAFILLLTGCNDDIFVEENVGADEINTTVDGDGGSATFDISTKHLLNISIDYYGSESPDKYYDVNGKEVGPDCSASDLGSIVYESVLLHYELVKDGSHLKFISYECAFPNDTHVTLRLEYSYTVRFIHITIKRGKPMEYVSATYDGDINVNDPAFTLVEKQNFHNDGPIAQTVEVWPMLQAQSYAYGEITVEEGWAAGIKIEMPVLQYSDGDWKMISKSDISPRSKYYLNIPNLLDRTNVTVDAGANVSIRSVVTVSEATATGVMRLRMPVSGREYSTRFQCTARFPKSYEVIVDEIDK